MINRVVNTGQRERVEAWVAVRPAAVHLMVWSLHGTVICNPGVLQLFLPLVNMEVQRRHRPRLYKESAAGCSPDLSLSSSCGECCWWIHPTHSNGKTSWRKWTVSPFLKQRADTWSGNTHWGKDSKTLTSSWFIEPLDQATCGALQLLWCNWHQGWGRWKTFQRMKHILRST